VANGGGAGDVYVRVLWENKGQVNTIVFHMDEEESVLLEAFFTGAPSAYQQQTFKWTARAALPTDTSQGQITVTRSTIDKFGAYGVGAVQDIVVVGNYAYVIVGKWNPFDDFDNTTLRILDISNPAQIHEVGNCFLGHGPEAFSEYHIAVAGGYAYVTIGHYDEDSESDLHIFDVSNPTSISKVRQYTINVTEPPYTEHPYGITIAGNYAYIVTQHPGSSDMGHLLILDITNLADPTEVGRYKVGCAESVAVKNNYAYLVGAYLGRVTVLDVSVPNSINEVGNCSFSSASRTVDARIAVSDNRLFAIREDGALGIFDISNPRSPVRIGLYTNATEEIWGIAVSGNYVYAAMLNGLEIIDISNSASPEMIDAHIGFGDGGKCIALSENYVFVAGNSGLNIYEKEST
jgi:hypothetical protein